MIHVNANTKVKYKGGKVFTMAELASMAGVDPMDNGVVVALANALYNRGDITVVDKEVKNTESLYSNKTLMYDFGGNCHSAILSYGKQGQFDLIKEIVRCYSLVKHDNNKSYSIEDIQITDGSFASDYIQEKYVIRNLSTGLIETVNSWIDLSMCCDVFRNGILKNEVSMKDRELVDFRGDLSKYVDSIVFSNEYGFGRITGLSGETYAVEYELDTGYIGLNISDSKTIILNEKVKNKIDMLNYIKQNL